MVDEKEVDYYMVSTIYYLMRGDCIGEILECGRKQRIDTVQHPHAR